jgi:uncharacterized protein involved in response to NO
MTKKFEMEPYQPFFFSGLLISLLGLGIWLLFQLGWISFYPMQEHAFLMIMGFLLAYIIGFLMTAVPKMSQTQSAQNWEIGIGLFLLWLQTSLALSGWIQLNYAIGIFQLGFLLFFIFRRLRVKKANPPKGFVFLPFGLLSGMVGCLLLSFPQLSGSFVLLGKGLLYQAFILNLILGLGSRLVPALTRVSGALDVRASGSEKVSAYVGLASALILAFLLEAFVSPSLGNILKFWIIAWMAVDKFKIFRPRSVPGFLGTGIRSSIYFLAFGFLLAGLFPVYGIHFLHLSYIGGFALLTFLISTRVVLAHGGYDLSIELKSRHLVTFLILVVAIAISRVMMGFHSGARGPFLWILTASWLALVSLWAHYYLAKLWKFQQV